MYKVWDIYPNWEKLTPLKDAKCKENWMKVGDLFVYLWEIQYVKQWEIVELIEDDGSRVPYFKTITWNPYLANENLAKLPQGATEETGIVATVKSKPKHTYSLSYTRSDWTIFTKETINGTTIEDLKAQEKEHYEKARKIRGVLNAHSKLKF